MYLYTSLQKKWGKILILKVDFVQYFDLDIDFVKDFLRMDTELNKYN